MKRDTYYDYIRAYAALLVFFTHKSFKLPGGSIGVDIFFCLSGSLITGILLRLPDLSVPNLSKFIFRRFSWIAKFTIGQIEDSAPLSTLSYMDQLMYGAICALVLEKRPAVADFFRSRWWFWGSLTVTFSSPSS